MQRTPYKYLVTLLLSICLTTVYATEHAHQHAKSTPQTDSLPASLNTGSVPSATFDHSGRLWTTWVHGEHIYVNYSDDLGTRFSDPIRVNQTPERIHSNGEARPKISVDQQGRVFIAYTQRLAQRYTGNIRFSRSLDKGKTFSKPITINDNLEIISHRFVTQTVDSNGRIYLTWLDARDYLAGKKLAKPYPGSSLYYSYSDDHGANFSANKKLADHTCQCCRIAVAMDNDQPVMFWRHLYEGKYRDHALLHFNDETPTAPIRATFQHWDINACPHHGPTISTSDSGRYHLAWFNHVKGSPGLYYAHTDDKGKSYSTGIHFGTDNGIAQHPYLLTQGSRTYLVWKTFDGKQSTINLMVSDDGGENWSTTTHIAKTSSTSDHPFLLTHNGAVYLSWHTAKEGYRLIEITP